MSRHPPLICASIVIQQVTRLFTLTYPYPFLINLDKEDKKAMAAIGLRGVGKTVLLGEYERIAIDLGWVALSAEVSKDTPFGPQLANLCRKALFQLSPRAKWTDRLRTAAAVVKSFSLTVQPDGALTAGLDMEQSHGIADSGHLTDDLADLFEYVGEAAREQGTGVVFLLDEIQFLSKDELGALIGAIHRAVQRKLPITFSGAGLRSFQGSLAKRSHTQSASSGTSQSRN